MNKSASEDDYVDDDDDDQEGRRADDEDDDDWGSLSRENLTISPLAAAKRTSFPEMNSNFPARLGRLVEQKKLTKRATELAPLVKVPEKTCVYPSLGNEITHHHRRQRRKRKPWSSPNSAIRGWSKNEASFALDKVGENDVNKCAEWLIRRNH